MKTIYQIKYKNTVIYVGSTSNLVSRIKTHKNHCFNFTERHYHFRLYRIIRKLQITKSTFKTRLKIEDLGKFEDYFLEEDRLIKDLQPCGNVKRAFFSTTEYTEYKQKWYEQNKTRISNKSKITYNENKQSILEKNKTWREQNKEILSEKKREYYQRNKEVLSEKAKIRYKKSKCQ